MGYSNYSVRLTINIYHLILILILIQCNISYLVSNPLSTRLSNQKIDINVVHCGKNSISSDVSIVTLATLQPVSDISPVSLQIDYLLATSVFQLTIPSEQRHILWTSSNNIDPVVGKSLEQRLEISLSSTESLSYLILTVTGQIDNSPWKLTDTLFLSGDEVKLLHINDQLRLEAGPGLTGSLCSSVHSSPVDFKGSFSLVIGETINSQPACNLQHCSADNSEGSDTILRRDRRETGTCSSKPCLNGRPCNTTGTNTYSCICNTTIDLSVIFNATKRLMLTQGWTGPNCGTDINECDQTPCLHGGQCKNYNGSFECLCQREDGYSYAGTFCQSIIDQCTITHPEVSINALPLCIRGNCSTTNVSPYFTCTCPAGYDGVRCDNDINECESAPCKNNGTCTDMIADYNCTCTKGFNGTNCDKNIDECLPNPCNNGTCTDGIASYTCSCPLGFNGTNCEINIDDCTPNPCLNGGTCNDLIADYTCTCPLGFTGKQCQTNIDDCNPNPCQNGGVCTDGIADHSCQCPSKTAGSSSTLYGGKNCTVPLTACNINPCPSNVPCLPFLQGTTQSYLCQCTAGLAGQNCTESTIISMDAAHAVAYTPDSTAPILTKLRVGFKTTVSYGFLWALYLPNAERLLVLEIQNQGIDLIVAYQQTLTRSNILPPGTLNQAPSWHQLDITLSLSSPIQVSLGVVLTPTYTNIKPSLSLTWTNSSSSPFASWKVYLGVMPAIASLGNTVSTSQVPLFVPFRGCLRDVFINDYYSVRPGETNVTSATGTVTGQCLRTNPCSGDPCGFTSNRGIACIDQWNDYTCLCTRKKYGKNCTSEVLPTTLGFMAQKSSLAARTVDLSTPPLSQLLTQSSNVSFYLITRSSNCFIYYLGSDPSNPIFHTAELNRGYLQIRTAFNTTATVTPQLLNQSPAWRLDDGSWYFVQFVLSGSQLTVTIIPPTPRYKMVQSIAVTDATQILATVPTLFYIGGFPQITSSKKRRKRSTTDVPPNAYTSGIAPFKGAIQDPEISGYKGFSDPTVKIDGLYISLNEGNTQSGLINDNTSCATSPTPKCQNNGVCVEAFYNTFSCDCATKFTGDTCALNNNCVVGVTCPSNFTCKSRVDGYDCTRSATFDGSSNGAFYTPQFATGTTVGVTSFRIRTRATSGTIVWALSGTTWFSVYLNANGTLQFQYSGAIQTSYSSIAVINDGLWHTVSISLAPVTFEIDSIVDRQSSDNLTSLGTPSSASVGSSQSGSQRFKGCLDDVRLGVYLLPFYNVSSVDKSYTLLANSTFSSLPCRSDPVCAINGCLNGGTCVEDFNAFTCNCPTNYVGQYCQFPTCAAITCQRNTICSSRCSTPNCDPNPLGYACKCPSGYVGMTCNMADPCVSPSNPCLNGGNCSVAVNDTGSGSTSYTCSCPAMYSGPTCADNLLPSTSTTSPGTSTTTFEPPKSASQTPLIIGLVVGFLLLIILIVAIVFIVKYVREKRGKHGVYNPHDQEVSGARMNANGIMKPPPAERLI